MFRDRRMTEKEPGTRGRGRGDTQETHRQRKGPPTTETPERSFLHTVGGMDAKTRQVLALSWQVLAREVLMLRQFVRCARNGR
jgi:hypothetical protein